MLVIPKFDEAVVGAGQTRMHAWHQSRASLGAIERTRRRIAAIKTNTCHGHDRLVRSYVRACNVNDGERRETGISTGGEGPRSQVPVSEQQQTPQAKHYVLSALILAPGPRGYYNITRGSGAPLSLSLKRCANKPEPTFSTDNPSSTSCVTRG